VHALDGYESSLTNDPTDERADPHPGDRVGDPSGEAAGETRVAGVYHVPVMLPEVLEYLSMKADGVYVDATLGGGGYAEAMLLASKSATVYGFDTDPNAMAFAQARLARFGARFQLVPENFSDLRQTLADRGITAIDGIVYDLGVSSNQLDTSSIGLSYRVEAPLDMRLDPRLSITAQEIIDTYDAQELKRIFKQYGEEPYAGPISRKIVDARASKAIRTTTELAAVVTEGVREDKRNATLSRIFQALRIEINQELESLRRSLEQAVDLLVDEGRIVVVSYHSLEDRIVKEFFKEQSAPQAEAGSLQGLKESIDRTRVRLQLLSRKAIAPSEEEVRINIRARSAKLRAARRVFN
jgi:16S rRNA (cytosine1402-N4)-methyltransferase